jgi:hypothetical protein
LLALLAIAAVSGAGCTPHPVGPARSFDKFEGKATTTAQSALSRVQTVRLAADAGGDGGAFGPYLSVLISEQEDALSGLQGTFGSIQPPDEASDALRTELNGLLGDALDHVATVRIATRRGQLDRLPAVAAPLANDARGLERFVAEHGG